MSALQRLLDYAGPALSHLPPPVPPKENRLRVELYILLSQRNGFYAFGQALHVLPSLLERAYLEPWDDPQAWSVSYGEMAHGYDFFAHDLFGNPFAFSNEGVVLFNAETGESEVIAPTLEGWAQAVLSEDYWTGAALARAWQARHGPLQEGQRLLPKQLFVLGGEYGLDNLYAGEAVEGLRFRASIAQQIFGLPDGAEIQLVVQQHSEERGSNEER